ncbi:uncharacterized protein LOC122807958 [Protopterus annectens]|uniref:uncharacterized protein LOC122807958 n=1 Tax=Protopterus annectens TaxID=7888 RepID=UPI001CF95BD3|nr:uncharacterized protein LOC122807958 [Protopterus annectens]
MGNSIECLGEVEEKSGYELTRVTGFIDWFKEGEEDCAGTKMIGRCTALNDTKCLPCTKRSYNKEWNIKFQCESCRICQNDFIYVKNCTATSNSVCTCKAGNQCTDSECTLCTAAPTSGTTTTEKSITSTAEKSDINSSTPDRELTRPRTGEELSRGRRRQKDLSVRKLCSQQKMCQSTEFRRKKKAQLQYKKFVSSQATTLLRDIPGSI